MIRNSIASFVGVFTLFARLHGKLRVVWAMLMSGMVLVVVGYFTREAWQSWSGLALMLMGCTLVGAGISRPQNDEMAAFFTALIVAVFASIILFLLIIGIGACVFLVDSFRNGLSWEYGTRLLHFAGMGFAFFAVTGVPQALTVVKAMPSRCRDELSAR